MVTDTLNRKELFAIWCTAYLNCIAVNTPNKFPSFRDFCEMCKKEMTCWEDGFDPNEDITFVVRLNGKQITDAVMSQVMNRMKERGTSCRGD
jgi:hypothetical protein